MRSKLSKSSSSRSNGFFANSSKRSSNGIQAKLKANKPGDQYEVEADKTADHVVGQSMGSVLSSKSTSPGADFGKPLPVTLRPNVSSSAQRKEEEDVQAKEGESEEVDVQMKESEVATMGMSDSDLGEEDPIRAQSIQMKEEDVQMKEDEVTEPGMSDSDLGEKDPIRAQAIQMKEDENVQLQEDETESEEIQAKEEEVQMMEDDIQAKADEDVQLQEDEDIQAKKFVNTPQPTSRPKHQRGSQTTIDQKLNDSKGAGSALPDGVKSEMENGFGVDFTDVRIHKDSRAESMNEEVGAKAFTHKNDIYFNKGEFDPESKEGKLLLAHELTHTIQQKNTSQNDRIFLKRKPNAEDKIQLAKFQVYKSALQAKRESILQHIQVRVNEQIPDIEANLKDNNISAENRKMLEGYKKNRFATWEKWVKNIDDAINFIDYEDFTYRWTLENKANKYDKIVWHSSDILSGWIRESESHAIHEMESSVFYKMGKRQGSYFAKLRSEGVSFEEAVLKTIGLGALDVTGLSGIVEGISGYDIATGAKLSTAERVIKGVIGIISVASVASVGGPRLAQWAQKIPGGNIKVLQMAPSRGLSGVMLATQGGGAVIALTNAEIITLVGAGILNTSVMHMSTGSSSEGKPSSISGLNKAHRSSPKGGGGNSSAKSYAKKVNESNGSKPPNKSVYLKGVEFDGFNPSTKKLIDAKFSKGKGSWYDITSLDSFTTNVKIPEIIKQAKRQLNVLKGSGASGIEWHISDVGVAKQIRSLFKDRGLNIIVKHTPL